MQLHFTAQSLNTLFEDKRLISQTEHAPRNEHLYELRYPFGNVDLKRSRLQDGLEISEYNGSLNKKLSIACETTYPHLEISHTFSGNGNWAGADRRDLTLSPGTSSLVYMWDRKVQAELLADEHVSHMEVRIDLRRFVTLKDELQRITSEKFYTHQLVSHPQIDILFQQLQQCDYSGSLRQLYLEGKCYELIASYLAGAEVKQVERRLHAKLSSTDISCLQHAREIIEARWKTPPSLLELSKLVGINDYKLKLGFKELFGTTVFGYIRSIRMREARSLLESGKANVTLAAASVGYTNLSHFSAAYRKTFGYNPSQCTRKGLEIASN